MVSFSGALMALVLVTVVGAIWMLLGPARLGGPVTPLVVSGTSMQPTLDSGDLVFLRRQRRYQPGDVVAFEDPDLGTVIHRIVASSDGRFVTRGDNRELDDRYHPTADDIAGRLWLRAPGLAGAAMDLSSPRSIALLLAAGLAVGFASDARTVGRARRPARGRSPALEAGSLYSPAGRQLVLLGVMLLLGGIALATLPIWRGVTTLSTVPRVYSAEATLSYGGPVAVSGVYDGDVLAPPAPVFRTVTTQLPITYRSEFTIDTGPVPPLLLGEQQLWAVVSDSGAWSRRIDLGDTTTTGESTGTVTATLDLRDVDRLIADFEAAAGLTSPGRYDLTIHASTAFSARLDDQPLEAKTATLMRFAIDARGLSYQPGASTPSSADSDSIDQPVEVARVAALPLVGDIPVASLTPLGGALAAVAVAALLSVVLATVHTTRRAPAGPARARLGRLLARAEGLPPLPDRTVEVATLADLAAIAEQRGQMVLEHIEHIEHVEGAAGPGHRERASYIVLDGDLVYRHTPSA